MSLDLNMDVGYVISLIYDRSNKIKNSDLSTALRRGISAVADYFIAKDSELILDDLVERYDIEFKLRAAFEPQITFNPSADGGKIAIALREKGIIVPQYVEEIVFCGKTLPDLPKGRYKIFNVHDDPNIGEKSAEYARKLQLPIKTIIKRWDFSVFEDGEDIRDYLIQAINEECPDPWFKERGAEYNCIVADITYEKMNNEGVVKNLFGDEKWRKNAKGYAKALIDEVIEELKNKKAGNIEIQKEFLDKMLALFFYYKEMFV